MNTPTLETDRWTSHNDIEKLKNGFRLVINAN